MINPFEDVENCMKTTKTLFATVIASSFLSACGGDMLSRSDSEKYKLIPEVVVDDPMAARPSPSAPVMKTDGTLIKHAGGEGNVLPVGVELDYGISSTNHFDALEQIAEVTAGAVRLVLTPATKVEDLEAALVKSLALGLTVNLTLQDETLYCKDNGDQLLNQVKANWFGKFLPIIAQDRYQPILMISIARGWGPSAVFDPASDGYREYMDYTKTVIRDFRKRGFKVPLVVEAPGCGEDYNAFDANRVRELLQADTERNLIFGLAAKSARYRSSSRLVEAANVIRNQRAPVIITELGGSNVIDKGPNLETLLDKTFMDGVVITNPDWQGPGDKVAYLFPLSEAQDIKNTQLTFDINLDAAYANADFAEVGGAKPMMYKMYLRDNEGRYAYIQEHQVTADTQGWITHSYNITSRIPANGGAEDGFDMAQVVAVGVELNAQDKPADVSGPIKFDNFRVVEGSGPAVVYSSDFTAGSDGWGNSQWEGKTATIATASGKDGGSAMSLVPNDDVFELKLNGLNLDLTVPVTIKAKIFIPASYADTDFGVGVFAANSSGWAGGGWAGEWNLTPGQWSDYQYSTDASLDDAAAFAASGGNGLGLQFSRIKPELVGGDAILIQDIEFVTIPASGSGEVELGVQHTSNFNDGVDGWKNLGGWDNAVDLELSAADGILHLKPKESGVRVVVEKANHASIEHLNFAEGFRASVTALIPESLKDKDLEFQLFFQTYGDWNHNVFVIAPEDIVYGDYHTYSITPEFYNDFDRTLKPNVIGLDFSASSFDANDEILISSYILEGQVPVEPEDVVLAKVDFNRSFSINVDFTDGTITSEQAKNISAEVVSDPIGWFASTWVADAEEAAGYNLVTNYASAGTLTERGEQVINLPGGLLELRTLLGYEPPEESSAEVAK